MKSLVNSTRRRFCLQNSHIAPLICQQSVCVDDGSWWWWADLLTNTRSPAATAFNAVDGALFNDITDLSARQQRLSLPMVEMAKGTVNVEADPWEATEAALSAFELDVVVDSCGVAIIRPIDPVESFFAQCGLVIHPGNRHRIFVLGWIMYDWVRVSDTQERSKCVVQAIMQDKLNKMLLSYKY